MIVRSPAEWRGLDDHARAQEQGALQWTAAAVGLVIGAALAGVVALLGYRRGVSRVREAERRARGAERLAEIGAMTGGLAHEIKNPLSTIGLNAALLVEAIEGLEIAPDERTRLLNRMKGLQRETDRLADILREFLEFAGKVHLERRLADVREVVSELVDFFTPEGERQGVRLRFDAPADPVRALIDVRHFKQAILNLMINATQAMARAGGASPSDGSRQGAPRELILRVERGKDRAGRWCAIVHVIDTGPGIESATLDEIFKPYFTTKPGGSGLGLPMSRRLIEEHGGQLLVHSEPGRGSDFAVLVPLGPEADAGGVGGSSGAPG